MSDYVRCPICHEYDWKSTHQCKPCWDVIRVEWHDEDDPRHSYGYDAEAAVLKFAEDNFSNWEYPMSMEIWVRRTREEEWQKFEVDVETVPSFSAHLKGQ
jgi:hypothetical protein